jgi:hypothetical protein
MISVIITGRNDSHGYNYHKRAAISLNCIAEVLTDSVDEIIFVDCNTPDLMPTFPEAIEDTLTTKTKTLLRVLRIRPHQVARFKSDGAMSIFDPIARNVAVRRSSPENRWILYTTSDMVLVPRSASDSLSEAVKSLSEGFYELPRFEIPECMWEGFDRKDPAGAIKSVREWSQRLHLNEAVYSSEFTLYDNPGDFQLMLREQLFAVNGSNERMLLPWHSDSNLCKRMALLNGQTSSFLDHCFAYHCTHSRLSAFSGLSNQFSNGAEEFVLNVTEPHLRSQTAWGLASEEIEEIRLQERAKSRFCQTVGEMLPGSTKPYTEEPLVPESFNHGLLYDTDHTAPFVMSFLTELHSYSTIAYFGTNHQMIRYLGEFLSRSKSRVQLLISSDTIINQPFEGDMFSKMTQLVDGNECVNRASIYIFDFGMKQFPNSKNSLGITVPVHTEEAESWVRRMVDWFLMCVEREHEVGNWGVYSPFLMIGIRNTGVETLISRYITIGPTPHTSHIAHGFALISGDFNSECIRNDVPIDVWNGTSEFEVIDFINKWAKIDEIVIAPDSFAFAAHGMRFRSYSAAAADWDSCRWVVVRVRDHLALDSEFLWRLWGTMKPVFANKVYICYTSALGVNDRASLAGKSSLLFMWASLFTAWLPRSYKPQILIGIKALQKLGNVGCSIHAMGFRQRSLQFVRMFRRSRSPRA